MLLRAVRRVSQLVTRERSPELLVRRTVDILVEECRLGGATIVLEDPFGLRVGAMAGPLTEARGLASAIAAGAPPACVRRALAGESVLIRTPSTDCAGCPGSCGVDSASQVHCVPVDHGGRRYGALHVILPPVPAPRGDEGAMYVELAAVIAHALRALELESQVDRTQETIHAIDDRLHATRQRAERALRESAEQYRTEFEYASAGRCLSTPDGRILRVNPALASLLGYDAEQFAGRAVEDFIHPDDLAASRELGLQVLSGARTSFRTEMRFLRADGTALWTDLSSALYRGAGGAPVHFITDVHDLTARKQAEAELQKSQDRYRKLIESLDELVYSVDRDGRLTWVSGAIARYGYGASEVLGHRFQEFAHPDDRAELEGAFAERLGADVGPWEFRVFDGAGKVRTVRSSGRRIFEEGRMVGLAGVLVDLTAQRSTEDQLRAAQKMEAIGRLAGGVAHDFNNLLTVINSYARIAAKGLGPEDRRRGELEEIRKAGERAAALTRQLLAFSRRQVLQPVVLDPDALIAGMERMLVRLIGEDVRLRVLPGADWGRIRADAGQVEQVLMNLAVNARDAMPGGGELVIETASVTLDEDFVRGHLGARTGDFVRLRIRDTGTGMDEATRERLFEPFFTTKPAGKGTGLGLATVYGIVKQSGGSIYVESAPGRGATFDVYFPRVAGEPDEAPASAPEAAAGRGAGTILFVEDDEAIRALAGLLLSDEGYEVLLAATGGEALVLAERNARRVDLVVTDVVMPGMNGKELAERLRPSLRDTPVLFMSGYGHDVISEHGGLAPGTLFIPKPFTPEALIARVREVLAKAS